MVALASVFSVIRNVSVPLGITTANQPNTSSTRWHTVADHKRLLYFFESALTLNTFWVDLKKFDLSSNSAKVMTLDLGRNQSNTFSGKSSAVFEPAKPFVFQGAL